MKFHKGVAVEVREAKRRTFRRKGMLLYRSLRTTLGLVLSVVLSPDVRADDGAAVQVKQIVAHRGSSADRPENTLASIRRAIEAGATAVEIDVRLTKDGVPVLSHYSKLDRATNGRGKVHDKTLEEIQRLDAGSWFDARFAGERVPSLEQALALCKGKVDALLDLKESGDDYDHKVVEVVKSQGDPARTILGVRNVEQAKKYRDLLPQTRQFGLIDKRGEIEAFAAAGVETIRLWPKWLSDAQLAQRVRKAGAKLNVIGTTGSPDETAVLLQSHPDSLMTDDPARLVATLAAMAK
jgi:glycerophosphoryl diester phosphodiesterase